MSLRQIRKLRKELSNEALESHAPSKITLVAKSPRFSFGLLNDSEEESSDNSNDTVSDVAKDKKDNEVVGLTVKLNDLNIKQDDESSESDWDKLLVPVEDEKNGMDKNIKFDKHFLYSPMQNFRCLGIEKTKRIHKSSNRNWLSPDLDAKESRNLRAFCLKQLQFDILEVDSSDLFVVHLTDHYREVDEVCSTAVNTQDIELFQRIFESQPYHIGTLMCASSINTLANKHEEAFRYLSLAIKMVQSILPNRFSLTRLNNKKLPNVYLPCDRYDNVLIHRLFLFYMISLERQGQWTVALSICKLLIAMDYPNDSSHALLHVDTYLLNSYDKSVHLPIMRFIFDYGKISKDLPALFWYLPNFAFSFPLQVFLRRHSSQFTIDDTAIKYIKDNIKRVLCLVEDASGIRFEPSMTYEQHEDLLKHLGIYSPYLILLRALLQYPQFVSIMASKFTSNIDLKNCVSEEPFDIEEDDSSVHFQLVYCYVVKSGELWTGNHNKFLMDTVLLVIRLFNDGETRAILESFQMLWAAFLMDINLPKFLYNVSGTEFDLANYSLPTSLESTL